MELKTSDGKILITQEEYEFLLEAREAMIHLRNRWFSEGRGLDKLTKKALKINEAQAQNNGRPA